MSNASRLTKESLSTFDPDDPINDEISKLNPEYRKQLDPYLTYNYKRGLWDFIGDGLGFNTAEDKYRMQQQDRARLALAGLQNDVFQNDYNSALAQAGRMRDAGINPDINGEVSGENAASLEQPLPLMDSSSLSSNDQILPNIMDFFGTAVAGLQSYGTLKSLLAQVFKTKKETAGVEIKNLQDAYDFAGNYLSSFDPDEMNLPEGVEMSSDFFNDTIIPTKVSGLRKKFPGMSDETFELVNRMINERKKDPLIWDRYYKNYNSGVKSRRDATVAKEVYGSLSMPDEAIRAQNKIYYDFLVDTERITLEYNKIAADYNLKKYTNDFDYESWKQTKGIPENVAEADLQKFLQAAVEAKYLAGVAKAKKEWLNQVDKWKNSDDPASQFLYNAFGMNMFAPLSNYSFGGTLGVTNGINGSLSQPIVPGQPVDPLEQALQGVKGFLKR